MDKPVGDESKDSVWIKMTKRQKETLRPLFDLALEAKDEGRKGAILGQPDFSVEEPTRFKFRFVDGDTSEQLQRILIARGYLPESVFGQ
jgi:hypothetical protein